MDDIGAIAEYLHFDMPRPLNVPLHVDPIVAKGGARFRHRLQDELVQRGLVFDNANAATAAAGAGLDHHWIADHFGHPPRMVEIADPATAARHHGHAGSDGFRPRHRLVAQLVNRRRVRPDKRYFRYLDRADKARVFRQEAVSWVHSIGTTFPDGLHE